jgi:hypothetical protein
MTAAKFALLAPEGELGTSPLMQMISIRNGDAKTMQAATAKVLQLQAQMQNGTGAGGMKVQMTYTPAGKTIGDVQFDQVHIGMDMAGVNNPQLAMIGTYMNFLYGQDGMNMYSGVLNDNTMLGMGGMSEEKMTAAINAAKSGDDPLSKLPGVTDIAPNLPSQRIAVMYVPIDTLVNTVFGYMAKFGLDMGVTMPPCDPIGAAVSTTGSTTRMDVFVPSQILTGASQVAAKLMVHTAVPPAQPAPGVVQPAPGGGL